MVRRGKPTLFVTFTFSPAWDEVTRELTRGEDCADQPFLVFNAKLKVLTSAQRTFEAAAVRGRARRAGTTTTSPPRQPTTTRTARRC